MVRIADCFTFPFCWLLKCEMPVFYAAGTKELRFDFVVTNRIAAITPITSYSGAECFREKIFKIRLVVKFFSGINNFFSIKGNLG